MSENMQSGGRALESHVARPGEPAASTSTNCYNFSSSIPYSPEQNKGNQYVSPNCTPYPTTKKRVVLLRRVYSTRTRGRSGALHSLVRKLGRFKVRTVIVQEIASEEETKQHK